MGIHACAAQHYSLFSCDSLYNHYLPPSQASFYNFHSLNGLLSVSSLPPFLPCMKRQVASPSSMAFGTFSNTYYLLSSLNRRVFTHAIPHCLSLCFRNHPRYTPACTQLPARCTHPWFVCYQPHGMCGSWVQCGRDRAVLRACPSLLWFRPLSFHLLTL